MNPFIRLGLDIGPLIIFFIANGRFGIMVATAIFMALAVIGLGITWIIEHRIPVMPLVSTGLVLVFGGLTLFLADESFIKIKPTLLYTLFAGALLFGLMRGQLWAQILFNGTIEMPDPAWRILTWRIIGLFIAQAIANEIIWRTQTTDFWIASKMVMIVAAILFFVAQTPFLMRHGKVVGDDTSDGAGPAP